MNTPEHISKVRREIHYQLALHIIYHIAREGLLAVMLDRGITMEEITESDRHNASLRADYGDTPYCAPDVDRKAGKCGGGDSWPVCCRGHRFEDYWFGVACEGDSDRGITHRYEGNDPVHPAMLKVYDAEASRRASYAAFPGQWRGMTPEAIETFMVYGYEGAPTTS
jgi:hypothetical protein